MKTTKRQVNLVTVGPNSGNFVASLLVTVGPHEKSGIDTNGVLVRGVSILKTKYGAAQALTNRSPWEIDRWLEQTVRDLRRLEQAYKENWFDYNLGDACDSYGGCQFRQVCKSPDPIGWLKIYFERRHWDPLERTENAIIGYEGIDQ